jgi:uncharacterized protein YfaS (alpha-2-macroglobulin family)
MELLLHIKNNTSSERTGQSELQLQDATTGNAVDGWFQNFFPNQYFTASANDSTTVRFPVEVPYTFYKTAKLRFIASAATDTVSATSLVPVFPYKQLNTQTAAHKGNGSFTLPALINSGEGEGLQHAGLQVHIAATPAPLSYTALSHLLQQEHAGIFAAANRLFAAGLLLQAARQQPDAAKALAMEINQPLFDTAFLQQQLSAAMQLLQQQQQKTGSFPWWAGGNEDAASTQYVALIIGRLLQLSAVPAAQQEVMLRMAKKAVAYLKGARLELSSLEMAYLEGLLGENKKASAGNIQVPATMGNEKPGMQAMMATVLWRIGDTARARRVLGLALQQNEMGNKAAAPPTHVSAIETILLLEAATLTGSKEVADSLSMSLLQQKNPQAWPTSEATTGAVYALLLHNASWAPVAAATLQMGNLPQRTISSGSYLYTTTVEAGLVHPAAGNITLRQTDTGPYPVTLAHYQYFDEFAETGSSITMQRQIFWWQKGKKTEWTEGIPVAIGDTLEVRLLLNNKGAQSHVQLTAGWPAGFLPLGSPTKKAGILEQDATGQREWWVAQLPSGRTTFTYHIRAVHPGTFNSGIAELKEALTGTPLARAGTVRVHVE